MSGTQSQEDKNNRDLFGADVVNFTKRINAAKARLEQLQHHQVPPLTMPESLPNALEELNLTMEELAVADEEIRQQHEELFATRLQVEEERQRYYELFEFAPDGYVVTDINGVIHEANRSAENLFTRQVKFLVGKPLSVLIAPDDRASFRKWLVEAPRNRNIAAWEGHLQVHNDDDQPIDVSIRMALVRLYDNKPHHLLWQLRDITELKQRNNELEKLSKQLLEVQETERRALSHELHDEIGQMLTGLKMMLMSNKTDAALVVVNDLIEQVRELSIRLHPAMLDDIGLIPTLEWFFHRYTFQTNITVNFSHEGITTRFSPEMETALYRITQESLTNVARHAHVNEVCVQLYVQDNVLHLEIQDEGVGGDPEKMMKSASSGLRGMRERATILGGELRIQSAPQFGCRIEALIPIKG